MKKFVATLLVFCVALMLPAVFACSLFCFSQTSADATAQEESSHFIVSANSAVVFAEPDFASEKIFTLKHKDEIVVSQSVGDSYKFFKINLKENKIESTFEVGYVLADLLVEKQDEIVAIPNFNAKTNKKCHVFAEENGDFVETDVTLEKSQEIFLYEGFNSKKDFNAISYVIDGEVFYGFLKTNDISPNGINPVIITCIVLIVALLSIIFAWLFMKNKHVRLKKKKPGKYDLN